MVKAIDENCAKCGKSQPKKGSLTQWVGLSDSCRCAVLDTEQSSSGRQTPIQESKDSICRTCGKHLLRNTGSLTQWVFRQDICNCKKKENQGVNGQADGEEYADHLLDDIATPIPGASSDDAPTESSSAAPADARTYEPGRLIARHYKIICCLGEGGTSVVYKAQHEFMDRIAAVKVLSPDRIPDTKTIQRFQQEARSVSRLKHPNIVDVHEFGVDDNKQPYLVMDYLDGKSLFETVEKEGPLKPARAAAIFLQMADALQHAHEKGVIHRDLKPTNAILSKDESGKDAVKLVDFGIAKLNEPEDKEKALTQTGEIFGSPFYMSPEQCRGQKLDHRSDIYSFGCLMYELIIGQPAAKGDSVVDTLMIHVNGLTPNFDDQAIVQQFADRAKQSGSFEDTHEHKCMTRLKQIIQSCIKKDPSERYQSMGDLKRDLERLLGGTQIFGIKESAIPWTPLANNTSAQRGNLRAASLDLLPIFIVAIAFVGILVGVILKLDLFHSNSKTESPQVTTKTRTPDNTAKTIVARLPDDKFCPVDQLTGDTVHDLQNAGVATIKMRNSSVSDEDLKLLSKITSLETLDITGSSGFNQSSLALLARLPKLKTLILAGTDVSDKSSFTLADMKLDRLDLAYTRFTEKGIEKLIESKTINHLKPLKILNETQAKELLEKRGWKAALSDWYDRASATP